MIQITLSLISEVESRSFPPSVKLVIAQWKWAHFTPRHCCHCAVGVGTPSTKSLLSLSSGSGHTSHRVIPGSLIHAKQRSMKAGRKTGVRERKCIDEGKQTIIYNDAISEASSQGSHFL